MRTSDGSLSTSAESILDPELGLAAGSIEFAPAPHPAAAPAAEKLRVTALDSGTYPMDGGGVATCRQIVLEGLPDVQWSVQAEIANDLKQVSSLLHVLVKRLGCTRS